MNPAEFGMLIKNRRRVLSLKQQDLADLAEVNINTIVAIERGTGNPKLDTLLTICRVLGLNLSLN